jgi:hypothetical protein
MTTSNSTSVKPRRVRNICGPFSEKMTESYPTDGNWQRVIKEPFEIPARCDG